MLKTFTASLIPAMALASLENSFELPDGNIIIIGNKEDIKGEANKAFFELNKLTSLTYAGGKNIKGEEGKQNKIVGDLKYSVIHETTIEEDSEESKFPENVEFGLCFESPDEGKPEYDCMRVRFNLEYDEEEEKDARFSL